MSALPLDIERLALLGWNLVPATRSKKGLFKGYLDAATHDLDTLEGWAREYPGCCWKVRPEGSGVFFWDIDVPGATHSQDGVASVRSLTDLHGPLPARPHGRSPSGGHLLVFRDPGVTIRRGSGVPAPGIDTLHHRLCAMVSPSQRGGGRYSWTVSPWELDPPAAPEWLLNLLRPAERPMVKRAMVPTTDRAIKALMRSFNMVSDAPKGARNFALLRRATLVGGYVAAGAIGLAEAERELIAAGVAAGQSRAEAQSTVRSGLRRGAERPIEWGQA